MDRKHPVVAGRRNPEAVPRSDATVPIDPTLEYDPEILREGWLRAAAELDNLRKRTVAEVAAARREERIGLLRAFLEVVDNLERALEAEGAADVDDVFVQGVQAVYDQMLVLLKHFGAEPIDALGEGFDPTYHEAIRTVDVPGQPQGMVAEVLQTGYRMDDGSVVRPARVVVVQHPQ